MFGAGIKDYTCSIGPEPHDNSDVTDFVPVVIDYIHFIEVDRQAVVINEDYTYVSGVEFVNGDVFNYTSISYDTVGLDKSDYPWGLVILLRGKNVAGDRVMNNIIIDYTNSYVVQTFQAGEAIGWVTFVSFIVFALILDGGFSIELSFVGCG